jgi:hypothetical protein
VDIGFIGQNVYLYSRRKGLACVFRASLNTERLARMLGLDGTQFKMFAQTVGYPQAIIPTSSPFWLPVETPRVDCRQEASRRRS